MININISGKTDRVVDVCIVFEIAWTKLLGLACAHVKSHRDTFKPFIFYAI